MCPLHNCCVDQLAMNHVISILRERPKGVLRYVNSTPILKQNSTDTLEPFETGNLLSTFSQKAKVSWPMAVDACLMACLPKCWA